MRRVLPWVLLAATVLWCGFIWHFSLASGTESAQTSGGVVETLNGFLASAGSETRFEHETVRKMAHFCEFAVLGVLAALTLVSFEFRHFAPWALLAVFAVGCVDELLQLLSPDRGPSFLDVLLDTAGGLAGIVFFCGALLLFYALCARKERKKSEINEKNP
ncbi:MAG: VanZ family protein [Clostridia bacterium]|nr:VanZ family protein [Clostridia bacterium]